MALSGISSKGSALLRRLTRRSSSNFKFAFLFLRPEQRDGLKEVYQFCRVVDDIVDERPPGPEGVEEARIGLEQWREELDRIYGTREGEPRFPLGKALAKSQVTFSLPREAFAEIIEGCAMDLEIDSYEDMAGLEKYCYRVASCVGLLCIGIFGEQGEKAQRYAVHLGLALQYTNILRDIGEDAARGRIYVPQELLRRHDLTPSDIFESSYDRRFLALASEFADLAEAEYSKAWRIFPTIPNRRVLLPAEVMGRTYHEILTEIRDHNFNVFTHRAALRRRDKLRVAAFAIARTNLPSSATSLSTSFSGGRGTG
jgi:phytoene synthase